MIALIAPVPVAHSSSKNRKPSRKKSKSAKTLMCAGN